MAPHSERILFKIVNTGAKGIYIVEIFLDNLKTSWSNIPSLERYFDTISLYNFIEDTKKYIYIYKNTISRNEK